MSNEKGERESGSASDATASAGSRWKSPHRLGLVLGSLLAGLLMVWRCG